MAVTQTGGTGELASQSPSVGVGGGVARAAGR